MVPKIPIKNIPPCLEEDVDGVAGEAAVGEVEEDDLVSVGQQGGEGVVDRQRVALALELEDTATTISAAMSLSVESVLLL